MAGIDVLVTGGAGRIGKRLVERLVEDGDNVTVIDKHQGSVPGVTYIRSPIADLPGVHADVVYHLAASIDYKASNEELTKLNVDPTDHLLSICHDCKQFIFMSTTSVYNETVGPINEYSKVDPYTNYGWSKLACEQLIRDSGIPFTIIRASQVYGPDFEDGYVTVLKHLKAKDMRILGSGDNFIPLVYIDDLIDSLVLVKDNKKAKNQIFNVDSDYQKTQRQFLEQAAKILGVDAPTNTINPKLAKIMGKFFGKGVSIVEYIDKLSKNRKISIDKLKTLGFEPKVTLDDGMRQTIDAFTKKGLI